jgi:hypothetical protein
MNIIDPRLISVPMEEALHIFLVALLCVQQESVRRPTMRQVVVMLTYFSPGNNFLDPHLTTGNEWNKPFSSSASQSRVD